MLVRSDRYSIPRENLKNSLGREAFWQNR